MKIFGAYVNRPVSTPEVPSGKRLVETAGFVNMETRIKRMLDAGIQLDQHRKAYFDTDSKDFNPDEPISPDREKGLDLAEASELQRDSISRLKSRKTDKETQIPLPLPVVSQPEKVEKTV